MEPVTIGDADLAAAPALGGPGRRAARRAPRQRAARLIRLPPLPAAAACPSTRCRSVLRAVGDSDQRAIRRAHPEVSEEGQPR